HRGLDPRVPAVPHREAPAPGPAVDPLFERRAVFSSIELDGWNMVVEMMPDGTNSFIKLPERKGPRSQWTTTLQHVRARNGETTYKDYGTPWSVVTRNLDITVARTDDTYVG